MGSRSESTLFTVVNLPKFRPDEYSEENVTIARLAQKTRDLRLLALKTAPEAFSSSYETEEQRGLNYTVERLQSRQADHFVAIDHSLTSYPGDSDDIDFRCLCEADWVGMLVKIGPLTSYGSLTISSKRDPLPVFERAASDAGSRERTTGQTEPLRYHFNGMFVDEAWRRAGLGVALFEAALAKAHAEAAATRAGIHCTVLVDSTNPAAKRLYEKMRFRATGEESYLQQRRLQMGETRVEERVAVKMELTRKC